MNNEEFDKLIDITKSKREIYHKKLELKRQESVLRKYIGDVEYDKWISKMTKEISNIVDNHILDVLIELGKNEEGNQ